MTLLVRRLGFWGAVLTTVASPAVAPAQAKMSAPQSSFTKVMGIDQRLGGKVPLDATFQDETGTTRTFGSVLKGRPVLVVPFPLRRNAGCGIAIEGLQKVLFKADHPNQRALFEKQGGNALAIGKAFDLVFLSLDPTERPIDAAQTKIDFQKKIDPDRTVEPITALTGDESNIRRVTNALGFRYFYDPATKALRNPTGSVLLTPDGRISSYTIGNDYPTVVLERSVETAGANGIGSKVDQTEMFGCVQLPASVIERRGKIETIITGFALLTLATVVFWIGSMLRAERRGALSPYNSRTPL